MSKEKSKNRTKKTTSKSRENLSHPLKTLKKIMINSGNEKSLSKEKSSYQHKNYLKPIEESKGKSKSKNKSNMNQKANPKIMKSKSKSKSKKLKVKMKKVQVSRLAESYSEYLQK